MNLIPFLSGCLTRSDNLKDKDKNQQQADKYKGRIKKELLEKSFLSSRVNHLNTTDSQSGRNFRKQMTSQPESLNSLEDYHSSKLLKSTDESADDDENETVFNDENSEIMAYNDWLKVLKNNDIENTPNLQMENSLRNGIPESLRPQIWAFLANTQKLKSNYSKGYFQKLKSTPSQYDDQIKRDLNRTFGDHFFFNDQNEGKGQQALYQVLRAYANFDEEVGYTQGMNFIAGTILIILDPNNFKMSQNSFFKGYDEKYIEETFWIFVHIFYVKNYRVIYKKEFPKLTEMINYLDAQIQEKTPDIANFIKEKNLETFLCFHQMFLSLLLVHTPIPISTRILDLFLIEGERTLFKTLIKALGICSKEIFRQTTAEGLISFLHKKLMHTCYQKRKDNLEALFPSPESSTD